MTIELTLAAIVSMISLSLAVASWLRTRRGDWTKELHDMDAQRQELERRVRALEDFRLLGAEYMRGHAVLPERLEQIERRLMRVDDFMELTRTTIPPMLRDLSKGRRG